MRLTVLQAVGVIWTTLRFWMCWQRGDSGTRRTALA